LVVSDREEEVEALRASRTEFFESKECLPDADFRVLSVGERFSGLVT
jgi:hypothetical protein